MAQTNQTINELIEQAYFLTGELSPDESVPGNYTSEGLYLLNDLINHFSTNAYNIPITKQIDFTATSGKNEYTVSNDPGADIVSDRLVSIEYMNYLFDNDDTTLYPMRDVTRSPLFNNTLIESAGSVPAYYLLKKEELQSKIFLYPTPGATFFMKMQAKFYLDKFNLNETITNVPLSEQRFLRYALARELTFYYPAANWTDKKEQTYLDMEKDRLSTNDIDMTAESPRLLRSTDRYYNGLGFTILGL